MITELKRPMVPTTGARLMDLAEEPRLISFFKAPIQNVYPSESLSLEEVYQRIRGKEYAAITQQLRKLQDPKQKRCFKARHFPYVTMSGVFSKRCEEGLVAHSKLLVVDLDDLEDLPEARQLLLSDQELTTELLFTSPSGRGLKWVVECDLERLSHGEYFQAVANYLKHTYGLMADSSGRDVSRACFLGFDPYVVLGKASGSQPSEHSNSNRYKQRSRSIPQSEAFRYNRYLSGKSGFQNGEAEVPESLPP